MPYQLTGPGWAEAFIAARNARQREDANRQALEIQRMKTEQFRDQQRMAELLPEARQYAAQGRPEMLRMLAPKEVESMEAAAREQQTARQNLAFKLAAEERARNKAALSGFSAPFIAAYNQKFGQLTPDKARNITQEQIDAVNKAMAETQTRKAPKTTISVGPSGELVQALTGGQQSQQQGKVINAKKRLQQLNDIDASIARLGGLEKMTDFYERGKQAFQNIAEKTALGRRYLISEEDKAAMAAYDETTANISGFANKIINELSGAAVSAQEWDRLVKSLPHPATDGPTMLAAKLRAWRRNIQYIEQFGLDALFNGMRSGAISIEDGAPVASSSAGIDTASQVVTDAMAAGADPEQAISSLVNAGKLDQEGAREIRKRLMQQGRAQGGAR